MRNGGIPLSFVLCHVRHGRKIDVFFRVVPKFLAMTKGKQLATVERLPEFRRHDDLGNVIGVAVHRDQPLRTSNDTPSFIR